ncbi:zinc finger protein 438 isoform X2 [Dasypus novemcinctus]|uniref:zinc finger protein 438 isoform X2 n=1 Tax=Dasypus novemcinctus TaxID=9361 RepID=UPI00265FB983|nr:zinc finger protein 438 isoform X2 [Dasypus novemcinctus]
MQNPLSVPPKDQGESRVPPATAQSRKGLQSKSQFRTIAPKIVPKVLTPAVLPCHSPSLSDHVHPGPSKPLVMPSQNYALMQLAGHEGTFSLVALPHVASTQPIQKPRLPLPRNLKLPIPRYQPPRRNKGSRKKPVRSPSESDRGKPATAQACPQPSPSPPAPSELPQEASSPKHLLCPDQARASTRTAALPDGGGHSNSGPPPSGSPAEPATPAAPSASAPEEPPGGQGHSRAAGTASLTCRKAPEKPAGAAGRPEGPVALAKAMTGVSPAVGGGAVQLLSSVPPGKLPILPYSGVKTTGLCKPEPEAHAAHSSLPGPGADCEKARSLTEGVSVATQVVSRPGPRESACRPAAKPERSHRTRPGGGAARRRGRKRRAPEETSAFQGRRRRCVADKCRDGTDRAASDAHEAGALRRYRSIRPKPVLVLPALAPPASPVAVLQSQDVSLTSSLASKYLGCRQNDSPSPKPGAGFRNGLPGGKLPWHRCHVCNHPFQWQQHLRDHMSTHANRRPYGCWLCRKAYVRPGSLSAHVALQHGENRPKRLLCCEFCAKVFGHIKVYFGHLKEVHRLVISTEPTPSEPRPGDARPEGIRDLVVPGTEGAAARESKSSPEDDLFLNQADEVKLQIRCGRCQVTAPSLAEIKFHLLYAHGEEIQGRPQEGLLSGSRRAQEDLVRHAASYWKDCPERRKPARPGGPAVAAVGAVPRARRPPALPPPRQSPAEPLQGVPREEPPGLHCLLCPQTLGSHAELLLHWERRHNCEEPSRLWALLHASSTPGGAGPAGGPEK